MRTSLDHSGPVKKGWTLYSATPRTSAKANTKAAAAAINLRLAVPMQSISNISNMTPGRKAYRLFGIPFRDPIEVMAA